MKGALTLCDNVNMNDDSMELKIIYDVIGPVLFVLLNLITFCDFFFMISFF